MLNILIIISKKTILIKVLIVITKKRQLYKLRFNYNTMTQQDWRKNLELVVEQNLNELIKETKEYDYAIRDAKDKSKAQIWVALAIINNKINQLDMGKKKTGAKIPKEELDKIVKTLETL